MRVIRFLPLLTLGVYASACLDFDGAYLAFCDGGACLDDGGSGGTGGSGGSGGSGGGSGGSGGSGGGTGGSGGGSGGSGGTGGSGGGSGGSGGSGGGSGGSGGSGGGSGGSGGGAADAGFGCVFNICYDFGRFTPRAFFTLREQGNNDVWVVGRGAEFWHWDGAAFTKANTSFINNAGYVWNIAGPGGNELRAAGSYLSTYVFNGTQWTEELKQPSSVGAFYSMWSRGPGDYVVADDTPQFLSRQGAQWLPVNASPALTTSAYIGTSAIHGPPGGRAIAVGGFLAPSALAYHEELDGGWTRKNSAAAYSLNAVFVRPDGGAVAVGDYNTVVHYSGGVWTAEVRPFNEDAGQGDNLEAVTISESGDIWVAGEYGRIGRKRPDGGWESYANFYGSRVEFFGLAHVPPDSLWAAGGIDYKGSPLYEFDGGFLMHWFNAP